jgi:PAS domain-containing protein
MGAVGEILTAIFRWVGNVFGEAFTTLFAIRRVALSVAALFVVVAAVLGFWSVGRADRYQRIVETALTKHTENTPQTFKALESLILVAAETDESGEQVAWKQLVENAPISNDFGRLIQNFDHQFRSAMPTRALQKTLTIAEPEITSGQVPHAEDAIITEENGDTDLGFLFLPVRLYDLQDDHFQAFRAKKESLENLVGLKNDKTEKDTEVCGSPTNRICDDVLLTRALLPTLKLSTQTSVTSNQIPGINPKPQQVYVITENEVNRIVSANGRDSMYRNQFRAATVFPARPYYVEAFRKVAEPSTLLAENQGTLGGRVGDYFYVSEPYLDIGGNGIVVTLARAYRYPQHSDGALCFDLKLTFDKGLGSKLASFVNRLDGKPTEVICEMSRESDPGCKPDGGEFEGDIELGRQIGDVLKQTLKTARESQSIADVVGNFSFVRPGFTQNPAVSAGIFDTMIDSFVHPNDEVRFAIPTDPPNVRNAAQGDIQLSFFGASLNIGRYLQTTAIAGSIALCCLGVALTIVMSSWATEARIKEAEKKEREAEKKERQELHEALDNVAKVMSQATVPYVRLDSEDYIVDANLAVAQMFGFPLTQDSITEKLRHTKFEDWLADDQSRREYHRIQKLRKEGGRVEPYSLSFRAASGQQIIKMVVSSVVPGTAKGSLPETFGILV